MSLFQVGDQVYSLNPKYKDGTRLRSRASDDSTFNGVWVPNDIYLTVRAVESDFVLVEKQDGDQGWIRTRNLKVAGEARVPGVTKDVITNELVTPDPEYVKGIKIYGCGIKEDPVPGAKFGKGIQHLISSQWVNAMSEFVAVHFDACQAFARHAHDVSQRTPGYDFSYFSNLSNVLANRADILGLRSQQAVDYFLMATWLCMAAAEVDDWPFRKYSKPQRAAQRDDFYRTYLHPKPGPGVTKDAPHDDAAALGKFGCPVSRRDLLPPIAMERLGINNELSALKYADPEVPLREGFKISSRMDSLKRHFEGVHRGLLDEDHVIHALWNFHAIYHVMRVFPEKLDLIDYSSLAAGVASRPAPYEPTTSLVKISSSQLAPASVLKLDWNEGAIPPPPGVCQALIQFVNAAEGTFLKWYPHLAGGKELRDSLCAYCDVISENLMVTNGSDDALILICQTFLGHGKTALVPCPTYEHFCVNAVCSGASLIRASPPDVFQPDMEWLIHRIEIEKPDLVYLVSPCNPTGVQYTEAMVIQLATRFEQTIFLVDEAIPLAKSMKNVIVTRTFSKAFCLASVRCGYLIAHPSQIETLKSRYNPKSINQFAQIAAHHALQAFASYYQPYITATNMARQQFLEALVSKGVQAQSGGAGNFVCVYIPSGKTQVICDLLEQKAIFVRNIGGRFPNYVRITIGLEMSRVAEAIVQVMTDLGELASSCPSSSSS